MIKENKKTNSNATIYGVIWRLSSIILVPTLILIYTFYMPIKWLMLGKFGFTKGAGKKWCEHLVWQWIKKSGL